VRTRRTSCFMRIAALALAVAGLPSSAFAIGYPSGAPAKYLHSLPASAAVVHPVASQDLRSPDARDAGRASEAAAVQDLRSPDARDAAAGLSSAHAAGVSPSVGAPTVISTHSASDGFEWGDAGVGAAFTLALLSLASVTVLLVGRTRRRTRTS
jgi:hypothetical protein